ncbi:MAG: sulfite exporter TauE/SafE family protein [Dehalococcoidia bacterium]|nr:sulfite exporter TauE/SafE family protein [Dehalococcoidia bacterium]
MELDWTLALAGLLGGFTVGLTGMGGGALMTPMLVLLFGVQPLAAVGSDLLVSFFMKPVGAGVHMRRGTVRWDVVRWLCLGSVPAAFAGVLVLKAVGTEHVESFLRQAIGLALLASAASMLLRGWFTGRTAGEGDAVVLRRAPTIAIGVLGGLMVGLTSVGSGSLIIVMLMLVYPALGVAEMVGTDLVQAIPLVGAAAAGHILFGEVELGLTGALLLGGIPGVFVGAQLSSRAPKRLVRPALAVVLLSSGLKLVGVL